MFDWGVESGSVAPDCRSGRGLVHSPLIVAYSAVGGAVHPWALLALERLFRDGQAVDAEKVAYARDNQVSPSAIDDEGKEKVAPKVPELDFCGHGSKKGRAFDRKVWVVDKKSAADHWH